MQCAISNEIAVSTKLIAVISKTSEMDKIIKRELTNFYDNGTRGKHMELCFKAFETIPREPSQYQETYAPN